jgi:hypothetical protein
MPKIDLIRVPQQTRHARKFYSSRDGSSLFYCRAPCQSSASSSSTAKKTQTDNIPSLRSVRTHVRYGASKYFYVSIKSIGKWGVLLDLSPVGRYSRIHTFEKYRIVLSSNDLVLKFCTWQVPLKSIERLHTSSVLTFWVRDSVGDPRVSTSCATRKAVTTELS